MGTILKHKSRRLRFPGIRNTHLRYALTYVLITAAALVFLNVYAATSTRNLLFQEKKSALGDKAKMAASALSKLEVLDQASITEALAQQESLSGVRVIVTNQASISVFDSLEDGSTCGKIVLFPEIVTALEGNDVFFCNFSSGALESHAAVPVMFYRNLTGCVYLTEYDANQGALIQSLQEKILQLTLMLETILLLFSLVFAHISSQRARQIQKSIRIIREGDYSHKLVLRGHDELSMLAEEFNDLTDRLQDSEERRRQFVSDASHELKTPLASIKLLADSILQNEMEKDTLQEFVGDISAEADRLTHMSQKLLSLSKMDAGVDSIREIVDVGDTVRLVLRMLAPVAHLNGVQLMNQLESGCTILTMEDDLYQIVFNLVENGIKYNHSGGNLTVTLTRTHEEITLEITDTGVGIPEEAIPHIFERFYRVDKARSRQAGGSGLGLSIVHDMVLRNDGSISVDSVLGRGSSFTVRFPFFEVEPPEASI